MILPLQTTFRNLDASPAVAARVREEAKKLEKYFDHITSCHVIVEAPHRHHLPGKLFHIRIELRVPGKELVVAHEPAPMHEEQSVSHKRLVGRGGNIVTARLPNVFHVRLVAPLVTRIQHSAEYYHLSEAEAAKLVQEQDQARRRYLRWYFNAEIDEPTLYDVTLNTGRMGFVRAAEVIAEAGLRHHLAFAERDGSLKVSLE